MAITPEQQRAYRRRRNAEGLCSACSNPVVTGKSLCQEHLDRANARGKERVARLKTMGVCCSCGQRPTRGNNVLCAECIECQRTPEKLQRIRERHMRYAQENKQAGLCIKCNEPAMPGKACCRYHLDYTAKRAKERQDTYLKQGLCRYCGGEPVPGKKMCSNCQERTLAARRRNKFGGNWQPAMERDNYQCQICGRATSLDVHHIDGRGEGHPNPNHALDNLIVLCSGCHSSITKFRSSERNKELALRLIAA